jgi:type IV pilus assembly protein PilQ
LLLLLFTGNVCALALPRTTQETPSFKILSLRHESAGATTKIIIETSAPPLYAVFRPTENQVVVEMPEADVVSLQPAYVVKSAAVDWITVRAAAAGKKRANIEIAVRPEVRDKSILTGNQLTIELTAASSAATAAPEKAPVTKGSETAMVKPGVAVNPPVEAVASANAPRKLTPASVSINKPAATPATDAANASKPATQVRGVRSESSEGIARIVIDADGATQYKDFTLDNPYRIVVDINNVKAQMSNQVINIGAAGVDKVRLGQPSAKVVRVVIDVKNKTAYKVQREGASLVVLVGSESLAKSVARTEAPATQPAESKPVASQPALPMLDNKSAGEVKVAGQRIDKESDKAAVTNEVVEPNSKNAKASVQSNAPASKPSVSVTPPAATKTEAKPAQATNNTIAANHPPQQVKPALADQVSAQVNPKNQPQQETANRPRTYSPNTNTTSAVKEAITSTSKNPTTIPSVNPTTIPASNPTAMPASASRPATSTVDVQRQPVVAPARPRTDNALCEPGYVGGLISFDLRAGVDLRDMLRFVSQQYGINFIIDKSVGAVPVDVRINDVPWNYIVDSVLKANRLGTLCERGGLLRVMSLDAIKEESDKQVAIAKSEIDKLPTVTKIIRLRYARAAGTLGGGGGATQSTARISSDTGGNTRGGVLAIAQKRLSSRGFIEVDPRTNSMIVTDLPEYVAAVEDILTKLDRPEPQVEIEARIVIASRNFLRDIGVELAAAAASKGGKVGVFQTSPVIFNPGSGITPGGQNASGSGSGSGTGTGTGTGGSSTNKQLGPNLPGPFANGNLSAVSNSVLSLTTGIFGTSIISAALTLNETKGQIRTIASPRVTTTDNQPAEIVNGVQIPVQTVSNNTITTTFVTAALRLNIVPQIIEDNGEVLMRVVAENNTVNFTLASQANNGTPGINTQSAESTVRVPDGGTTILGGINIDNEGHTVNRTPGVSRIPIVGELFKRRTIRRDFDEIIFFITPRIIRNDQMVTPKPLPPLDGRVENVTKPSPSPKQ